MKNQIELKDRIRYFNNQPFRGGFNEGLYNRVIAAKIRKEAFIEEGKINQRKHEEDGN